jgi:CheY-like chemotaxis protein
VVVLPPAQQVVDRPAAGADAVRAAADAVAVQREAAVEALRQARRRAAADVARIEAGRQAAPPPPRPAQTPPAPRTRFQAIPSDAARPPSPAAPAAATPRPARPALPVSPGLPAPASAGLPPTVLVVDDSKVVRIKTSRLLEKHQYRVVLADDGLTALQAIEAQRPDLVITDVEMPGLDGFALTQRLRAHPRWAGLPVIMITSSDDKHRADAAAAGVNTLLGKPYAEEVLLAEVRKALATARSSAAHAGLALQ